jgi:hypothetical protein
MCHINIELVFSTNGILQPTTRLCYGRMLFLIVYKDGVVGDFNAELLQEIEQMPSLVSMELFCSVGSVVRRTVDCFTFGGVVRMLHADEATLLRDYNRIREIEEIGFIHFA